MHDTAPHPILRAAARVGEALSEVAEMAPAFMRTGDKARALRDLSAAEARLVELRLRVLAVADDVAEEAGAQGPGQWLAHATRVARHDAVSDHRLAVALDRRWGVLAEALRVGHASLAQARVVARALDRLPTSGDLAVPAETLSLAEKTLVTHCEDLGPRELARLGARVLEVVAPEAADAVEARRLAALEASADERTRLSLRRRGDGTTRITGLLPDHAAARLATYLEAYANPHRQEVSGPGAADPFTRLSYPRQLGQALVDFLEAIDASRLPLHGGDATTVIVTVPLAALREELGAADLLAGRLAGTAADGSPTGGADRISAAEARRLACGAGIIPAVLDGASAPLDLGRTRRLFSPTQRKALLVRDRTCRAEGCDVPGTWCHAHHWDPWSAGGRTDLADGVLLCGHHHRRVHDPRHRAERLASGDVRFHRRR
ncbi:MAG: HNH endonuclease [Nocardioides sp.]|nr:HNH endonuclease [Nocardioides sp.]